MVLTCALISTSCKMLMTFLMTPVYLVVPALGAIRNHSWVGHVEAHVEDGALTQPLLAGHGDGRLGHGVRQRLQPEHQLLVTVLAVQHPAHHVPTTRTPGSVLLLNHQTTGAPPGGHNTALVLAYTQVKLPWF